VYAKWRRQGLTPEVAEGDKTARQFRQGASARAGRASRARFGGLQHRTRALPEPGDGFGLGAHPPASSTRGGVGGAREGEGLALTPARSSSSGLPMKSPATN